MCTLRGTTLHYTRLNRQSCRGHVQVYVGLAVQAGIGPVCVQQLASTLDMPSSRPCTGLRHTELQCAVCSACGTLSEAAGPVHLRSQLVVHMYNWMYLKKALYRMHNRMHGGRHIAGIARRLNNTRINSKTQPRCRIVYWTEHPDKSQGKTLSEYLVFLPGCVSVPASILAIPSVSLGATWRLQAYALRFSALQLCDLQAESTICSFNRQACARGHVSVFGVCAYPVYCRDGARASATAQAEPDTKSEDAKV